MKWINNGIWVVGALMSATLPACRGPVEKIYPIPPAVLARSATGRPDTADFPVLRDVRMKGEDGMVDMELPYTRMVRTESNTLIVVLANYEGKQIGFELSMPPEALATARFASIGQPSDNFLQVLRKLFKMDTTDPVKFVRVEAASCLSMGANVDSLRKNGHGEYVATAMNKLFFEPDDSAWEAECYLNVDTAGHWVEFMEKDEDYRKPLIRDLSARVGM